MGASHSFVLQSISSLTRGKKITITLRALQAQEITSRIRFSQCVKAVPSPPWSSNSAPSSIEQLKCPLTSSTTRGVTIMSTYFVILPPRMLQFFRTTLLIVSLLHWNICNLFKLNFVNFSKFNLWEDYFWLFIQIWFAGVGFPWRSREAVFISEKSVQAHRKSKRM